MDIIEQTKTVKNSFYKSADKKCSCNVTFCFVNYKVFKLEIQPNIIKNPPLKSKICRQISIDVFWLNYMKAGKGYYRMYQYVNDGDVRN